MEYAPKGDLKSVIKKQILNDNLLLEEDQIWKWFVEIVAAVKYIHSRKIIHRDIKVENIFISSDNNVKLGDFGISKSLENSMDLAQSGVGTPYYLSPEICQGLKYNFKTDIWMMGCLLYELSTLKKPFKSESIKILIQNIIYKEPEPIANTNYSDTLIELISIMLKKQPEKRPSIEEIWVRLHMCSKTSQLMHPQTYSHFKTVDKNKLKIEVEEENLENGNNEEIDFLNFNEKGNNSLLLLFSQEKYYLV